MVLAGDDIPKASSWKPGRVQAKPDPTKLNQAKLLGFAWFCSSESGLFKGLRREK
jgi:hypothetical protein